jgi:hypothetical protein
MRLLPAVALVALVALLVVALAQSRGSRGAEPRVRRALTVSGRVRSLFPGAHARLPLVVRNNRGFPIRLLVLKVRGRDARRGCGGKYLQFGRLRRSLVVPRHGYRMVVLPVMMLRGAPDACQHALWPLRFTIGARRA